MTTGKPGNANRVRSDWNKAPKGYYPPIEQILGLIDVGGAQPSSELKAKLDNGTLGPTGPHVVWQKAMEMSAAQKKAPGNKKKLLISTKVRLHLHCLWPFRFLKLCVTTAAPQLFCSSEAV